MRYDPRSGYCLFCPRKDRRSSIVGTEGPCSSFPVYSGLRGRDSRGSDLWRRRRTESSGSQGGTNITQVDGRSDSGNSRPDSEQMKCLLVSRTLVYLSPNLGQHRGIVDPTMVRSFKITQITNTVRESGRTVCDSRVIYRRQEE